MKTKIILCIAIVIIFILTIELIKKPSVVYIEQPKSNVNTTYLGEFLITHYAPTGKPTFSGVMPKVGRTVACDKKLLGKFLYVEKLDSVFICEDTGAVIKDKVIDVFVDNHKIALEKGIYNSSVYIIGD